jgi:AcrR family transcriptional regulator
MDAPRRLSRRARRDQLVAAALPLVARHGPADLSLDDVAERAGVTRNLLYHYFPAGRSDLVGAVVDEAERQLAGPARARDLDQAISRILDHALAPTHAWRIHRMARALPTLGSRVEATALAAIDALREFTGVEPSPLAELALYGYVAYAEAVLDRARVAGIPRSEVARSLARTLRAVVGAE